MTPRTGFVLAGGGFKGAFELGALDHLVNTLGVLPDVITSASAGSILGMVVSQARTAGEFGARLGEARQDLLSMTAVDLVFGEEPWLRELQDTRAADAVRRMLLEATTPELPGTKLDAQIMAGTTAAEPGERPSWSEIAAIAQRLPGAVRAHLRKDDPRPAVLNLDPFEAAIRGQGGHGITPVDPRLIARPGVDLRMAVTAFRAKATHYVCGDGTLVGADAKTPVPDANGTDATAFDVIDGAIASCSMPGVFPARRLGSASYVDGGVLQNIPLRAAVELEAERIFTLIAIPLSESRRRMSRWAAEELGYLSTQEENLATPLPPGTTNTVIAPTLAVIGSFEVHPGLMLIDIDYGHMRAEEGLAGLDEGARPIVTTASDTITLERARAWRIENDCIADGAVTPAHLETLRAIKRAVRSAVNARTALGFPEPNNARAWWEGPEHHSAPLPDGFPADLG